MSPSEALGMREFRPNTKVGLGKIVEVRPIRGVFVVFEGTNDMGKSTQTKLTVDWIKTRGWEVVTTYGPGGTNLGRQLWKLLLGAGEVTACERQVAPRAGALLFAADRAQHVAELIVPVLNAGKIVISGRFMASSMAYQGQGRDSGPKKIRDLSLWAAGGLTPSPAVLLGLGPEIAWECQQNGETRVLSDRMEGEGLEFQRKVQTRFRRLAEENETWMMVGASLTPEEIAAQVRLRLASVLSVTKSWWNLWTNNMRLVPMGRFGPR